MVERTEPTPDYIDASESVDCPPDYTSFPFLETPRPSPTFFRRLVDVAREMCFMCVNIPDTNSPALKACPLSDAKKQEYKEAVIIQGPFILSINGCHVVGHGCLYERRYELYRSYHSVYHTVLHISSPAWHIWYLSCKVWDICERQTPKTGSLREQANRRGGSYDHLAGGPFAVYGDRLILSTCGKAIERTASAFARGKLVEAQRHILQAHTNALTLWRTSRSLAESSEAPDVYFGRRFIPHVIVHLMRSSSTDRCEKGLSTMLVLKEYRQYVEDKAILALWVYHLQPSTSLLYAELVQQAASQTAIWTMIQSVLMDLAIELIYPQVPCPLRTPINRNPIEGDDAVDN